MMMLSCFSFPTVFPVETSYSPTKRAGCLFLLRLGQAVRLLAVQGYAARRPKFTCSTRLPRGNQVDGLPRALTSSVQTVISAKTAQNLTIYLKS